LLVLAQPGASELTTIWANPDFDAMESAFYYVRVLEIPTPRWLLYDKVRLGAEIPDHVELIHQERAYTSPVWYTPKAAEAYRPLRMAFKATSPDMSCGRILTY
jgi:hypothetical protein